LLVLDSDKIAELIENLDKEILQIKNEAMKLAWHMRGSLSYNEALALSFHERDLIAKMVKENFETTKKTGLPYF